MDHGAREKPFFVYRHGHTTHLLIVFDRCFQYFDATLFHAQEHRGNYSVGPQVSIVIVNWNTRNLLLECLASIQAYSSQCEVVVVDNGSTDGSVSALRSEFPNVIVIDRAKNEGYARANMAGFRAASGEYILFLNSDTLIPNGAIDNLVAFLECRPRIAACGPRLLQPDGKAQPFAFGNDPTLRYLLARACARIGMRAPLHDWETSEVQNVDWVSGACLLIRRSAFEQIGGFDEQMFMYFEDNDICLRLRKAGWGVAYNPHVAIAHIGGASLCDSSRRRRYYYQSLRYFFSKHYSIWNRAALRVFLAFYGWWTA
jgi:N-acetylglucosaminyl-diphospho-decaprenol L-rhamnosyltransferase